MKFKHLIVSVVTGAALVASAGSAMAATYSGGANPAMPTSDINIYGASAQYTFWKTEGPLYLTAAGCTLGVSGATADNKHFIQQATCGANTINFRVSSKASYDGPLAVDGNSVGSTFADTTCSDPFRRPMIDPATCVSGVCAAPTVASCVPVTIGASDVLVGDFKQKSVGALKGPAGGAATTRDFKIAPITVSGSTTNYCSPQVISFAPFVNASVVTAATTSIMNISSAEMKMIFSRKLQDWNDLQAQAMDPTSRPIQLCFRHAGSGTHATFDAWMKPSSIPTNAITGGTNKVYFNDGSADLLNCVNTIPNAIGYADADVVLTSYPNVHRLTIDNVNPLGSNVDDYTHSFSSTQRLYVSTATAADPSYQDLCTFASRPTVIAAVNPNWSASCNMKRVKASNFGDFVPNPVNNTTYPFSGYHNVNCD